MALGQTHQRFAANVRGGVIHCPPQRLADGRVVGFDLGAKSEYRPVAHVLVRISGERDECRDRRVVFMPEQPEDGAVPR